MDTEERLQHKSAMDQRLQEYVAYYEARLKKYENNPMYPNSRESERALYEAIKNAPDSESYKKKLFGEKLHVKNAIALVKDQETAREKHFREIKEFVRAKGPASVLAAIDRIDSVEELTTKVSELTAKNGVEINVDELTDQFWSDFTALENIEVAMRAEVPSQWKAEMQEYVAEQLAEGRKDWKENVLPNARNWDPNWKLDYNLVFEERHRRKIPVPDATVKRRIEDHKKYRGT